MIKRVLLLFVCIALFLGIAAGTFVVTWDQLPSRRTVGTYYTRPAAETLPAMEETTVQTQPPEPPPQTLPPETEATQPPETQSVYQRHFYESVPLYDQTAYENIRYRSGTIATSGSNIAALAMAASYVTGEEYLPDELGSWFATFIGNPMEWVDYVSDQLQLPWERPANIDVTLQALREGKIAVVVMKDRSIFREVQHFVVFTGITEDGKILVNDPYAPNYEAWHLKNAFANGFSRGDLTGGYAGAWVYDPAAVGEMPFVYSPPVNTDVRRYPELELTEEDKTLLAQLISVEAASEPFDGQQAVAEVILNRIHSGNFPDTLRGVVFAEGQFLAAQNLHQAKPTHTQYTAVERALNGPYVLPEDVVFFSQWAVNDNVWGTIGNHTFCHEW